MKNDMAVSSLDFPADIYIPDLELKTKNLPKSGMKEEMSVENLQTLKG